MELVRQGLVGLWDDTHVKSGAVRTKQLPSLGHREACNDAVDYILDPVTGSPGHGRNVVGIINLHVDDIFGTGNQEFEQCVLQPLRKNFMIGSEDWSSLVKESHGKHQLLTVLIRSAYQLIRRHALTNLKK